MQDIEEKAEKLSVIPPRALLNIEDYHQRAKGKLQQMAYDYYSTGADDHLTVLDNQQAFRRIKLRPKILVDVSSHLAREFYKLSNTTFKFYSNSFISMYHCSNSLSSISE